MKPVWNETFEAYVDNDEGQEIQLKMFDEEKTGKDAKMGMLEVDITSVAEQGTRDLWLPLDGVKSGKVHINLAWCKLSASPKNLRAGGPSQSSALLMVKIKQGKNLPNPLKDDGVPAVYCKVNVEEIEKDTYHVGLNEDTKTMDWKQALRFLVKNHKTASITVEVIESKGNKKLGNFAVPVNTIGEAENMVLEKDFILKESSGKGTVACKFTLRALVPGAKEINQMKKKRSVRYSERNQAESSTPPSSPQVILNGGPVEELPVEDDRHSTCSSPTGSM